MPPARPITDLRGMLNYSGPPVTIEWMDEAIAAETTERDLRSLEP
jgi:hypothetical protein